MRTTALRVLVAFLVFTGVSLETPKDASRGKIEGRGKRLVGAVNFNTSGKWRVATPTPFSNAGSTQTAESAHSAGSAYNAGSAHNAGSVYNAGPAHTASSQRSEANERWSRFLSEYVGGQSSQFPEWAKDAVMVDLPLASSRSDLPSSVPVLVLPVPVPARDVGRTECTVRQDEPERFDIRKLESRVNVPPRPDPTPQRNQPEAVVVLDVERTRQQAYEPNQPAYQPKQPAYEPKQPVFEPKQPVYEPTKKPAYEPKQPVYQPKQPTYELRQPAYEPPPPVMPQEQLSPEELVELFRAQVPRSPQMPPVLIRERRYDVQDDTPEPPSSPQSKPGPSNAYLPVLPSPENPPHPVFDRPLMLRGEITVYRADYTEPYVALWDPSTGAARIEMHAGATTTYRTMAGGRVQRAAVLLDRTGENEMMRCVVMKGGAPLPSDKHPPVLPDTKDFKFDGFTEYGYIRAEMWRHTVSGGAGQMGAAQGEALVFRHELLLMRGADYIPMPLQYSVSVDSSLLGPDCDGYVHRYHEVREQQVDPNLFQVDLGRTCERMEETQDTFVVEPLLEFTMLSRDPRYDNLFKNFTAQFDRKYAAPAEEAVRKNLLVQNSRFIASGNRISATFEMATNFLSDRLDKELAQLLGVVHDAEHFPAELFPHERGQLRDLEAKLPEEFDWREKGGVTSVRYQGASCSSCWAFAVTGAVEGALFRTTRKLVALSEQCLVDCAQPYGGRGCKGTWPSHAYDYIQDRGLPALDEYTPYKEMVGQCRDKEVPPVTQISAHVNVTAFSVPALKVAIRKHAPTVVIIDANQKSFQNYKKGVYYDDRCNKVKGKLLHAVLAVGWGARKGEPHFILKNSWSAAWGDEGYIRMHGPSNTCGQLTLPSYPRLEREDVRALPGGAGADNGPDV